MSSVLREVLRQGLLTDFSICFIHNIYNMFYLQKQLLNSN